MDAGGDAELGEANDFFVALMIFADHFGEDLDPLAPVESGAEAVMKAEFFSDALDPEFGAGGGEDELEIALFVVGDFFEDFRVGK